MLLVLLRCFVSMDILKIYLMRGKIGKLINLLFLFFMMELSVSAQVDKRHELVVGLGVITSNDVIDMSSDFFESIFTLGGVTYDNIYTFPALNLGYKYPLTDEWFSLFEVSYQNIEKDMYQHYEYVSNVKGYFLSVGAGVSYLYVSNDWLQIYSGLSIAYTFIWDVLSNEEMRSENDKRYLMNLQFNAIGIRAGKRLGVFFELGMGYKGIANLGASYQL